MNDFITIGIIILCGWIYIKWWSNKLIKIMDEKLNSQTTGGTHDKAQC